MMTPLHRPALLVAVVLASVSITQAQGGYLDVLNKARQQAEKTAQKVERSTTGQVEWTDGIKRMLSGAIDSVPANLAKPEALKADEKLRPVIPRTLANFAPVLQKAGKADVMEKFDDAVLKSVATLTAIAAEASKKFVNPFEVADAVGMLQDRNQTAITDEFRHQYEARIRWTVKDASVKAMGDAGLPAAYRQLLADSGDTASHLDPTKIEPLQEMVINQTMTAFYGYLGEQEAATRAHPESASDEVVRNAFSSNKR